MFKFLILFCINQILIIFHVKLDDPLDSVAVHGTGGVLGLLAVPFFMYATLDVRHIYIFEYDIHVNLNRLCPNIYGIQHQLVNRLR